MSPHTRSLPYFKGHPCPEDWSITEYLNWRHRPVIKPRRILEGWKKSLQVFANCTSSCCTPEQRLRARDLIARYNEKVPPPTPTPKPSPNCTATTGAGTFSLPQPDTSAGDTGDLLARLLFSLLAGPIGRR